LIWIKLLGGWTCEEPTVGTRIIADMIPAPPGIVAIVGHEPGAAIAQPQPRTSSA
jgi:hypothetical protein